MTPARGHCHIGEARIRIGNRERSITVAFLPAGVSPLLGATTLEALALGFDSVGRKMVPVDGLMKQEIV